MTLSKERVVEILQDAFRPLVCTAEWDQWNKRFGFRFFRPEGSVSIFPDAAQYEGDRLRDAGYLEAAIRHWRQELIDEGYALDSWAMPPTEAN